MEQISDHSAPGAPLELGKARDHLVVVRLKGDLNARFDSWHGGSWWTL
ncbi:TPA: hypothetical protein L5P97_006392 [Pseudomonas aeruginosa]|nr:hypothetical protein [Pseudomonas aeruginosa]HBP0417483.1 hypothetical protein [Pseudomonas aeruginosa]HBP0559850.1 hypothetical protein [Pseudomonas aeruginosa]HBP0586417.1 hypothetical protein [Pseudomonas aeruginosa]HBP0606541.1 hypothetical protein [Pseudomonas aeruginosa]